MTDHNWDQQAIQVDIPVLEQLAMDTDPSLVPQLLAMFLADGRQSLIRIDNALASSDDSALAAAAHALGGSMATFGLSGASRIVQQCETALRKGDVELGKEQARQILIVAPRAFDAIASYADTLDG
jgi:HPt (histidine-containing phosphotransfer) domain-containing protein